MRHVSGNQSKLVAKQSPENDATYNTNVNDKIFKTTYQ